MDSLRKAPIPPGTQIPVFITKVVSVDKVYIRFLSNMEDYIILMSEMKRHYDQQANPAYVNTLPEGDDAILDSLFILKRVDVFNRVRVKEAWSNNSYYVELLDEGFDYLANETELILNDNPVLLKNATQGFVFSLDLSSHSYDKKKNYLINYGLQKIVNSKESFFLTFSPNNAGITLYYQDKNNEKVSINESLLNFLASTERASKDEIEANIDSHLVEGHKFGPAGDTNVPAHTVDYSAGLDTTAPPSIPKFRPPNDGDLRMKCKHVFNPSDFFLKLKKTADFKRFIDDLNAFYDQNAPVNATSVLLNHLYITNYKDKWIRLQILGAVNSAKYYSCLLFDKGIVGTISDEDIYDLDDRFKKVPPRSVKSALAFIKPSAEKWTKEANEFFKSHVKGCELTVYPITYEEDGIFYCSLIKGDENISDMLNQKGFAETDM